MSDELICPICGKDYNNRFSCPHNTYDLIRVVNSARSWAGQMYVRALAAEHELAAELELATTERLGLLRIISDLRADIANLNAAEK